MLDMVPEGFPFDVWYLRPPVDHLHDAASTPLMLLFVTEVDEITHSEAWLLVVFQLLTGVRPALRCGHDAPVVARGALRWKCTGVRWCLPHNRGDA